MLNPYDGHYFINNFVRQQYREIEMNNIQTLSPKIIITTFEEYKETLLPFLFKATGGGISLIALTSILKKHDLISNKVKNSWYSEASGESFTDLCNDNNIPSPRIAKNTVFENGAYVPLNAEKKIFKDTLIELLELTKRATSQRELKRVLLGKAKIEGFDVDFSYNSTATIYSQFRKYFGTGITEWSSLSSIDISEIPDFISLTTTKFFFNAYLNEKQNWQDKFLYEAFPNLNVSPHLVEMLKNDSQEERISGEEEFIKFFREASKQSH